MDTTQIVNGIMALGLIIITGASLYIPYRVQSQQQKLEQEDRFRKERIAFLTDTLNKLLDNSALFSGREDRTMNMRFVGICLSVNDEQLTELANPMSDTDIPWNTRKKVFARLGQLIEELQTEIS